MIFGKNIVTLQREINEASIMRVIARKKIVDYYSIHPQAKTALDEWYAKTEEAEWKSLADIKQTFNSVDYVGNQHYVFNIKGWQRWIVNPLSKGRDQTRNLMVPSRIR